MVDKAILLSALGGDEPKALRVVEPLDGSGRAHRVTPKCVVERRNRSHDTGDPKPYGPTTRVPTDAKKACSIGRPLSVGTCPRASRVYRFKECSGSASIIQAQ